MQVQCVHHGAARLLVPVRLASSLWRRAWAAAIGATRAERCLRWSAELAVAALATSPSVSSISLKLRATHTPETKFKVLQRTIKNTIPKNLQKKNSEVCEIIIE